MDENTIEIINKDIILEISNENETDIQIENINVFSYSSATEKPSINSVQLEGNKSSSDLGLASVEDLTTRENIANKVTNLTESVTQTQYPSARCVKELLDNKADADLSNLSIQGQTIINLKADNNLSNLSSEGTKKLSVSRIYDSGISTDTEGYAKVHDLKHSTFDLSKATVVGSPTITDDGVASGFNSNNCINIPNTYAFRTSNNFELNIKFQINSISDSLKPFCRIATNNYKGTFGFLVGVKSEGRLYVDGFASNMLNFDSLNVNTWYILKIKSINSNASFYLNDILIGTTTYTKNIDTGYITLGAGTGSDIFDIGSIDLKHFSIAVDGVEVYNCVKTGIDTVDINGVSTDIPYAEAITGAKIVNATYRDRVQDWYEQSGEGNYYTIDEENENFTLPLPDLYGLIEKNKEGLALKTDMEQASAASMPSTNHYIELTLGASGSSYTAPANGWFAIAKVSAAVGQQITMINNCAIGGTFQGKNLTVRVQSATSTPTLYAILPAKKGDTIIVTYTAAGNTDGFIFIYAEGAN